MTTQQPSQVFDEAKAEEFGNGLVGTYMGACKTLVIDLGHRSGLWESLAQGPATSIELAERSGLNERYVRECLGGATVSGYVDYDPETKSHTLPAEHAASLVGETGANLSSLSPMITFLGGHVSAVLEAFTEEDRRQDMTNNTNIFRVLIKTLLKAGIITDRTRHVYQAWVDMDELAREDDEVAGGDVALAAMEELKGINQSRQKMGARYRTH